jgi:hypothetical protein
MCPVGTCAKLKFRRRYLLRDALPATGRQYRYRIECPLFAFKAIVIVSRFGGFEDG